MSSQIVLMIIGTLMVVTVIFALCSDNRTKHKSNPSDKEDS